MEHSLGCLRVENDATEALLRVGVQAPGRDGDFDGEGLAVGPVLRDEVAAPREGGEGVSVGLG